MVGASPRGKSAAAIWSSDSIPSLESGANSIKESRPISTSPPDSPLNSADRDSRSEKDDSGAADTNSSNWLIRANSSDFTTAPLKPPDMRKKLRMKMRRSVKMGNAPVSRYDKPSLVRI